MRMIFENLLALLDRVGENVEAALSAGEARQDAHPPKN